MEDSAAKVPRWVYKQASVTFHSVAAYFWVEEWERLEGWEQTLYTEVMKEIHRALLSLGHKIGNPDILFQIKQQEDPRFRRSLDSDEGEVAEGSGVIGQDLSKPDLFFRIKEAQEPYLMKSLKPEVCRSTLKPILSVTVENPDAPEKPFVRHFQDTRESNDHLSSNSEDKEELCLDNYDDSGGSASRPNSRSVGVGSDSVLKVKQEIKPCPSETPNKASKEKSSSPTSSELVYRSDMSLWIKQVDEPMLGVSEESDTKGNLSERLTLAVCQKTVQSELPRNTESHSEKSAHEHGFRKVDQVNRFQCNTCMKCFIHFSSFKAHHRTHTGEKPFKCTMCRKSFSHSSNLTQHVRIHTGERPHTCAECDKAFTTKSHLITHQRLHSGERPHVCGDCGKTFTMKSHLVTHQRLHTGERPYKCNECIQSYRKASDLVRHKRIHTGEKPYHCSLCEKRFNNLQCLKIHQRSHTGEKPFQCSQCEKGFLQNSDLIRHQKTHTGERPFQCNQCEKNFPQRSDLVRHEKIHSAERSYKCTECDKGFNLKSGLTRHQKLHIGMGRIHCDISTPSCIDFFHCKLDSPKSAVPI